MWSKLQICIDNASNYVSVRPFWTPSVTQCLDLILKDIGKTPKIKEVISGGHKIVTCKLHLWSQCSPLKIFDHIKLERVGKSVSCGVIQFVTSFHKLQTLKYLFDESSNPYHDWFSHKPQTIDHCYMDCTWQQIKRNKSYAS